MDTSGTLNSIPNENVIDSGVDDGYTMTPSVTSADPGDSEKRSTPTPPIESDLSDSISVVETIGDHTTDHMPDSPSTPAKPMAIAPKSINLDNLPLHSPSQIVGTPFANDNTRFEYPFPETNRTCSSGSDPPTPGFSSPTTSSPSSGSFPTLSTSSQLLTQLSFPPSSHYPSHNATHPKMKVQANPPIPPNLIKRRLKWGLNLLGRRRSSAGSQQSLKSDESTMANITDGQEAASPPGSPTQERANH